MPDRAVEAMARGELAQRLEILIGQLEVEVHGADAVGSCVTVAADDRQVMVRQHLPDIEAKPAAIERLDLDRRHEHSCALAIPLHLDETGGVG